MARNPELIAELIREAESVALCCHINPDGDTLGAATAMALALEKLGKKTQLFCDDKVPDQFLFLPGVQKVHAPGDREGPFDLMLSVDVSDEDRLGSCVKLKNISRRTAQIDHHPTNPLFMEVNSVDGEAPAACLLIREQIRVLGVALDQQIAVCLYTGISTDTGNFSFAATNAACFEVMVELMGQQLPLAGLNRVLFRERAVPQARLLGRALNGMSFSADGKIAVMKLTRRDFEDCGALSEHADTIVNFALDTIGTRMAILARETDSGLIKFSLRSKEPDTVNEIAQQFGGGGHPQAAGITMEGDLESCVANVLDAMIHKLDRSV